MNRRPPRSSASTLPGNINGLSPAPLPSGAGTADCSGCRTFLRLLLQELIERAAIQFAAFVEDLNHRGDRAIELFAVAFARCGADDVAGGIDEDLGGPGADGIGAPDAHLGVARDRMMDVVALHDAAQVLRHSSRSETSRSERR